MRLAVVSPFVDRRHGTERALAELLERLARDYQCEIHLYSQRVADLPLQSAPRAFPSKAPGIFWHKVPAVPGPQLLQFLSWFHLNRVWRWAHRRFRGASFDLLLSPGINCADADVILVHALFHRLRELSFRESDKASARGNFLRLLHRRAYYGMLARLEESIYSDRNVALAAVSQRTAGLLARHFDRQDVAVIPNGVDTSQFSPVARLARRDGVRAKRRFRDGEFVLLMVGNDWANKGLPTILEALSMLSDIPGRLLVVGEDAPAPFQEMARRLGVFDWCTWEASAADILDAYAAADIYVSPSREDAFALPPLEVMACGLPVITSVNNGGSQIITHGVDGFVLSDAGDAVTLARLLKNLREQPELSRRIGENAARTAQAYSWDRNAAALWGVLRKALDRGKSLVDNNEKIRP